MTRNVVGSVVAPAAARVLGALGLSKTSLWPSKADVST